MEKWRIQIPTITMHVLHNVFVLMTLDIVATCYALAVANFWIQRVSSSTSSSSFCGASGILPNALQPTEDYCANPTLVPPFISRDLYH
jgi:hypothetical protein